MTTHFDDADLSELIHTAAPARTDPLDHARLQTPVRRRRAARRVSAATAGLGTIAALIVAAPLALLPSTSAPTLSDGDDHADPDRIVADDAPTHEFPTTGCPNPLTTSWACLAPGTRPDAPDLDLDVLDVPGGTLDLSKLQGRRVVLTVWADWCGPCVTQQPDLNLAQGDDADVVFLGIATDTLAENAASFVSDHQVGYSTLLDPDGGYLTRLNRTLERDPADQTAVPATYIIDNNGRIAAWTVGRTDHDELSAALEHVTDQ